MKKIILLSMIAFVAAGILGCSPKDETKADLKWTNSSGSNVADIKWISNGQVDQSWSGTTATGSPTAFKGIKELAGTGDCIDSGGNPATVQLTTAGSNGYSTLSSGGASAVIQENAAATLVISGTTPAK